MVRLTAWVSDEQKKWVEDHAEEHNVEQAEVIRQLIDAARYGESPLNQSGESTSESHDSESESLRVIVADLEERVTSLENERSKLTEPSEPDKPVSARPTEDRDPRGSPPEDTPTEPLAGGIKDLLNGWPPRGEQNRDDRREVALAALRWLRDEAGVAGKPEFVDALYDEHPVGGQGDDTWWRKTVRPALMEADEAGIVEFHEGRWDYEWKGE